MFNILLGSGFGVLAGAFVIWRGKCAIRDKYMANSAKSSFFTGVTHMSGEKAVRVGKINVVLGIIMMVIAGSIFALTSLFVLVDLAGGLFVGRMVGNNHRVVSNEGNRTADSVGATRGESGNSSRTAAGPRTRPGRGGPPSTPFNNGSNNLGDNSAKDIVVDPGRASNIVPGSPTVGDGSDNSGETFEEEAERIFGEMREAQKDIASGVPSLPNRGGRGSRNPIGRSQGGFGDRDREVELGKPSVAMPLFSFDKTKAIKSNQIGFDFAKRETIDAPPEGGIMVGLIVGEKEQGRHGGISSLQAVYQVGDEYHKGNVLGSDGGSKTLLIAPAGYAVYGLEAASGVDVTAIRLGYMRMDETGRMLKSEKDVSEWVGKAFGQEELIDTGGKKIVALFIASSGTSEIAGLGLFAAASTEIVEETATSTMRIWKSANGKFSITADFVSKTATKVTLKKADGTEIESDIKSLSEADQQFISEQD